MACYLPVVGTRDDHSSEEVKLAVVDWGCCALGEVGVSEDCFHALKLLSVAVEQFAADLVQF